MLTQELQRAREFAMKVVRPACSCFFSFWSHICFTIGKINKSECSAGKYPVFKFKIHSIHIQRISEYKYFKCINLPRLCTVCLRTTNVADNYRLLERILSLIWWVRGGVERGKRIWLITLRLLPLEK